MPNKNISADEAWSLLLSKYSIPAHVASDGMFYITAKQIKAFKEPRLMAKWDSSHQLPKCLQDHQLNLLPVSRRAYVISDFLLYEPIPALEERPERMVHVELPPFETIDADSITSESTAIDALLLTGILDDFLESDKNSATFHGRMSSGEFSFVVDTVRNIKREVHVQNAQCEIDGGFENEESVVILEAKNVVHEDFHIRQLYYPYRLWLNRIQKPIRLVFAIYSNQIFRLFEYCFANEYDYSSIKLIRSKNYSLQDTMIQSDDLTAVREQTKVVTDDNMDRTSIPFPQANSMDRVISLLENLHNNSMTRSEIAELMDFELRQSDYYYNAGKYLGLFDKVKENGQTVVVLTNLGEKLYKMQYKERQLKLVGLMLEHQIFAELFDQIIQKGELPDISEIERLMRAYNVCNEGQINRRASSVLRWLRWIFNLTQM